MASSREFWEDKVLLNLLHSARNTLNELRAQGKFADRVECVKVVLFIFVLYEFINLDTSINERDWKAYAP